jgi:hypothetical protein
MPHPGLSVHRGQSLRNDGQRERAVRERAPDPLAGPVRAGSAAPAAPETSGAVASRRAAEDRGGRAAEDRGRRAAEDRGLDGRLGVRPAPGQGASTPARQAPPVSARGGTGVPGRRTVRIQGRGSERYSITPARRRPPRTLHERAGINPDRVAMWAVLLGVLLVLAAAASSRAAVLSAHAASGVRAPVLSADPASRVHTRALGVHAASGVHAPAANVSASP